MGELQVKVNNELGKIQFNFEELKENLSNMMELYKDAKFSEDTTVAAKKEVATLRKIKKALDTRRIEIKKEYMQPYDDFEIKVKELKCLIDEPIELIDKQVKAFEKKKKEEKRESIEEMYKDLIGNMQEYLPLTKIYNNKWENASVSMKSIQEEMDQAISSTTMAVQTIQGMNSDVTDKALEQYKQDLSLANAISYINKHEQMKAEILAKEEQKRKAEEERKRKEEEERIREEERKRVAEEERIRKEAEQKAIEEERKRVAEEEKAKENLSDSLEKPFTEAQFENKDELPFVTVGEVKATFTVVGTPKELEQIEMYLNSIGMTFERKDV